MKVAVIGSNGQLGCDLCSVFSEESLVVALTHRDIEIGDDTSCKKLLDYKPNIIINTAAFHNVPKCEEDPQNSFQVNALGALNIAAISAQLDAILVHISTDYVFSGEEKRPYTESDLPEPVNVYGVSKLAGEHLVKMAWEKSFIIRTSGLYGEHKCRAKERNFAETMVHLAQQKREIKVVTDEFLTPTYTLDLANQIKELVKTDAYGLFHATNEGSCSWYEFAKTIFNKLKLPVEVLPVSSTEFPSKVRRPGYSVLENTHLKKINCSFMRPWQEALTEYVSRAHLV
ncbi:dTDP-4-dehydrorhamnose reductase [Chlamydiota bacterium]